MFTCSQLAAMRDIEINKINKSRLIDAGNIRLEDAPSKEERIRNYLEQIENPYCFRCGDVGIKVAYTPDAPSLQEILIRFFTDEETS